METKRYWNSLEDLNNDPEYVANQKKEFINDPIEEALSDNLSSNRRNFLKYFGFSVGAAAALTACSKAPVKYALPYIDKPVDVLPSVANYYASTFFDGLEYNSVLVKTREGRPIKIEGNPSSSITKGGTSARAQASVLGLYDTNRLDSPTAKGQKVDWKKIDEEVGAALGGAQNIRIVSSTIISPSTKKIIGDFLAKYPSAKWVVYDPISSNGIAVAHEKAFGKRAIPTFRFDKADLIVSFNADFLGTWISPTEFTAQYASKRKGVKKDNKSMSRHVQFESALSLTGANADLRVPMKPSQEGAAVLKLYNEVASKLGKPALSGGADLAGNSVAVYADQLTKNQGKSLVVSGSNDPNVQLLVAGINQMLGNYGQTIDIANHSNLRGGDDKAVAALVDEMNNGSVGAVLFINSNPAYTYPDGGAFAAALGKVGLKISFADSIDETAKRCDYVLPSNHYLESWDDAEAYKGFLTLTQPAIEPLYKTRQYQECFLRWLGDGRSYYNYIRDFWKDNAYPAAGNNAAYQEFLKKDMYTAGRAGNFEDFWRFVLSAGVFEIGSREGGAADFKAFGSEVADAINASYKGAADAKSLDVVVYQKIGIGSGAMANIPWLQEMPDPLTKATWDNYVTVSPALADELKLRNGSVVTLELGKAKVTLPVFVLPGMQRSTVGVALGYGRTEAGEAAKGVGQNAYPFASFVGESFKYYGEGAKLTPTGDHSPLAVTQTSGTIMGRNIVYETTLADYDKDTTAIQEKRGHIQHHIKQFNLYKEYPSTGHQWAMVIDLNACTGCGACVVSCQAENNVPVVGKDEVLRGREMHWIRIDRYFSSNVTQHAGVTAAESDDPMKHSSEIGEASPEVVFQPMMCQHCDNAPCENVCPVLATTHSNEGLNQMTYNRCFGTRYCANNCPYKVRRFNWLDYSNSEKFKFNPSVEQYEQVRRMVLNPDVATRARGVMEKCSFCVQRIQSGKLEAKKAGRPLMDADIKTACQQACPAGAIVFGDMNNPESEVSKWLNMERSYQVIEEVKTLPAITYLTKVRNQEKSELDLRKEIRTKA